jgi:hypothetical protein
LEIGKLAAASGAVMRVLQMPTQINLAIYLAGSNLAQPKNHEVCNSWYSFIGCCSLGTGQKELDLLIDRLISSGYL